MTTHAEIGSHTLIFPLNPYLGSGTWRKKIKARVKHFGTLDDPAGAIREFEEWKTGPDYSD